MAVYENVMVSSNRIERRWTTKYTDVRFGDTIQAIPVFRTNTGTQYILVLTENGPR